MEKKTTVLMILDGFGLNDKAEGNAVKLAKTPVLDGLMQKYPFVEGYASGLDVGLPAGQMGNSEVGHLNMGAGRVVYQELTRITKAIEDGDFFENPTLLEAVEHCKKNNSALHLYGLLSDGGVIATIPTCTLCCSWQKETIWRRFMCMFFWTAEIPLRPPVRNMPHSWRKKCAKSA